MGALGHALLLVAGSDSGTKSRRGGLPWEMPGVDLAGATFAVWTAEIATCIVAGAAGWGPHEGHRKSTRRPTHDLRRQRMTVQATCARTTLLQFESGPTGLPVRSLVFVVASWRYCCVPRIPTDIHTPGRAGWSPRSLGNAGLVHLRRSVSAALLTFPTHSSHSSYLWRLFSGSQCLDDLSLSHRLPVPCAERLRRVTKSGWLSQGTPT